MVAHFSTLYLFTVDWKKITEFYEVVINGSTIYYSMPGIVVKLCKGEGKVQSYQQVATSWSLVIDGTTPELVFCFNIFEH
jgi:regulatory protein YycI of two-component signal transduction system YycFG